MQRPTPEERQKAEARARASIEARYGHPLTDAEWDKAKANLRAFFGLLAQWQVNNRAGHRRTTLAGITSKAQAVRITRRVGPDPDCANTCANTFRRRKAKKEPPGLCNLSGLK